MDGLSEPKIIRVDFYFFFFFLSLQFTNSDPGFTKEKE